MFAYLADAFVPTFVKAEIRQILQTEVVPVLELGAVLVEIISLFALLGIFSDKPPDIRIAACLQGLLLEVVIKLVRASGQGTDGGLWSMSVAHAASLSGLMRSPLKASPARRLSQGVSS